MIRHVGEGRLVNFRVRPCCLCCICPKGTIFNKNKIKLLRGAVYQVQCLFSRKMKKCSIIFNRSQGNIWWKLLLGRRFIVECIKWMELRNNSFFLLIVRISIIWIAHKCHSGREIQIIEILDINKVMNFYVIEFIQRPWQQKVHLK